MSIELKVVVPTNKTMSSDDCNLPALRRCHEPQEQCSEKGNNQRPVSFYDNCRGVVPVSNSTGSRPVAPAPSAPLVEPENTSDLCNSTNHVDQEQDASETTRLAGNSNTNGGSPSLAYCLNTTVPQNIVAATIAGRHAPTRNSLRHSRMIVLSRTGRADKYKGSGILMRRQGLARALVGLQTVLGSLLLILALWLLIWAPNIPRKDNPYWSALPLLFSGIFGLVLLGCCSQKKYKVAEDCCVQSSKIFSIFLSIIATFACCGACFFALLHIVSLSGMTCEPAFALNTTCVCKSTQAGNGTSSAVAYHYIDLNCPEVDGVLSVILIFSCTANGIAAIIATLYVYLHWKSRYLYDYSSVRTNDNRTSVYST